MKHFLPFCVAAALATLVSQPAKAELVISGEFMPFKGPGLYTLDILALGLNIPKEVGGFNIDLDFSDPNASFQRVAYHSAFESIFPIAPGTKLVQLQATDLNFSGVVVGTDAADPATLATITFSATRPTRVAISIREINDTFFEAIDASLSVEASDLAVIPEPSGGLLLALGAAAASLPRRRRS